MNPHERTAGCEDSFLSPCARDTEAEDVALVGAAVKEGIWGHTWNQGWFGSCLKSNSRFHKALVRI